MVETSIVKNKQFNSQQDLSESHWTCHTTKDENKQSPVATRGIKIWKGPDVRFSKFFFPLKFAIFPPKGQN